MNKQSKDEELMYIPKPDLKKQQARSIASRKLTVENLCNRFPSWNDNKIKEELGVHLN